jgi:uncharacterized membrane protein (DUF485 family)
MTQEIDPQFLESLKRRNRLRSGFSVVLIGIYLTWGVLGIRFPDFYASPFLGIAMPTGLAMAFAIIGLSMLLAVIYVRQINRFEDEDRRNREQGT